jgi:hypothetical protein
MQANNLSAGATPCCTEWPIFGESENADTEGFASADKALADNNKTPVESRRKRPHRLCRMAHGGEACATPRQVLLGPLFS